MWCLSLWVSCSFCCRWSPRLAAHTCDPEDHTWPTFHYKNTDFLVLNLLELICLGGGFHGWTPPQNQVGSSIFLLNRVQRAYWRLGGCSQRNDPAILDKSRPSCHSLHTSHLDKCICRQLFSILFGVAWSLSGVKDNERENDPKLETYFTKFPTGPQVRSREYKIISKNTLSDANTCMYTSLQCLIIPTVLWVGKKNGINGDEVWRKVSCKTNWGYKSWQQ